MSEGLALKISERRYNQRVVVNQPCTLHFSELFNPVKATIVDLSAGGMRLRIPRIQEKHLAHAFKVKSSYGALDLNTSVYRLYALSEHEIAVRYSALGLRVHGEITKFVFSRLRRERDLKQKLASVDAEEAPATALESRRRMDGVEGYYQSRGGYWLERRKATHLCLE